LTDKLNKQIFKKMKKTIAILFFIFAPAISFALIDGAYYDTQTIPYNAICDDANNYFWIYDQNNLAIPLTYQLCSYADGIQTFNDAGILGTANPENYNVVETSDTDPTASTCYNSSFSLCLVSPNEINSSEIQIYLNSPPPPPSTTTPTTTPQMFAGGFSYGEILIIFVLLLMFTLQFFVALKDWLYSEKSTEYNTKTKKK
jgi:hypothetical protein